MSLESISPSDGQGTPRPAGFSPAEAGTVRPDRRESRGVEEGPARVANSEAQDDPKSREELGRLVEEANTNLAMLNERLDFQVHDGTGQIVVQVVDRNNGEIIRETPSTEFLDLAVRLREMVGLFLDERR